MAVNPTVEQCARGVPRQVEETDQDVWLATCERAARAAGRVLGEWVGRFGVENKGPRDLVTEADRASQRTIREILIGAFPEHGFVGEEGDDGHATASGGASPSLTWVVDPLDGTTNYVHGYPAYCVSIALVRGDVPIVATILDPLADECFTASAGGGAWCNGRPMRVSGTTDLAQSLVAASFPSHPRVESAAVADFLAILPRVRSVRRSGSSALNLAWLACGRLDAFWARRIQSWDVAAGFLLVAEAGGAIGHFATAEGAIGSRGAIPLASPAFIAASSGPLLATLQGLFAASPVGAD